MLSRELGTHLTGRYLLVELFPFSFREYILFTDNTLLDSLMHSSAERSTMQRLFGDYSRAGGFPGKQHSQTYNQQLPGESSWH